MGNHKSLLALTLNPNMGNHKSLLALTLNHKSLLALTLNPVPWSNFYLRGCANSLCEIVYLRSRT